MRRSFFTRASEMTMPAFSIIFEFLNNQTQVISLSMNISGRFVHLLLKSYCQVNRKPVPWTQVLSDISSLAQHYRCFKIEKVNVLPCPSADTTVISPPRKPTIFLVSASPIPVPW